MDAVERGESVYGGWIVAAIAVIAVETLQCNVSTNDTNEYLYMGGSQKFKNKYRIKSARMPGWDYSGNGHYFITICTDGREHFFGSIKNGMVCVTSPGAAAYWYWREIPRHFHHVSLDAFVVMPNHVHGIVIIDHGDAGNAAGCRECQNIVQCRNEQFEQLNVYRGRTGNTNVMSAISPKTGSLSAIIRSFKSECAKTINRICPEMHFAWQKRFHDHVIRNEFALNRIRTYIRENPRKWNGDVFFSA